MAGSSRSIAPEVVYGEPATPFVATFVGTANLVHGEYRGGHAMTRFGAGPARRTPASGAGVVAWSSSARSTSTSTRRPTARSTPARGASCGGASRGTEILYEVVASDEARLWVEAGHAVRRLRLGDAVTLRLRDVETVMFPSGHPHPDPAPAGAGDATSAAPQPDRPATVSDRR